MTNTEAIIRTILRPIRRDTRPWPARWIAFLNTLCSENSMDEIMVTKDIYPEVAKQLNKIAHHFPLCGASGPMLLGGGQPRIPCQNHWPKPDRWEPREMLFISPVYSHWNVLFFTAVQAQPLPVVLRYNPFIVTEA